ncbi:sialidase family protein [Arthrobacter echini]|uniref:sialidase family protein n=1 Tax=Arthrobacter echini TaxID=1529066 RepID=UPI001FE6169D|nr:sialidase family protein [Arthrobacter echini]
MKETRTNRRAVRTPAAVLLGLGLALGPVVPASAEPAPIKGPAGDPGTFSEENSGEELIAPFASYRIPALAYLGDGVVLASWDGRPFSAADAPNPNSIVQRRSVDGGRSWGPIQVIAAGSVTAGGEETPRFGYSDPSYVVDEETGSVFAFFVHSKDQGFQGSAFGNDDANRNVISSAVIESTDGGLTWSQPRLITGVTKPASNPANPQPGDIRGNFATSGEGIQLKYGQYAGRLIQQYVGDTVQPNGSRTIQAYSVYSDDHGATWQKGSNVGVQMDENKTVELSDGRVMLNSRDSGGGGYRKVAISTDGGQSYGPVTVDQELPDPTNNASITRLFPDAPEGSPDARKLLFSNSNSQSSRSNLAVRVSCDDGQTWPSIRGVRSGFAAYSTLERLDEGRIGLLYESSYSNGITFAGFDDAWLNYTCAPLEVADIEVTLGEPIEVPVTITNQEQDELSGQVTIDTPTGWTAPPVDVPTIAPGATATVTVTLTPAANASPASTLDAVFTSSQGGESRTTFRAAADAVGLTITGAAATPDRDLTTTPYQVGDRLAYNLTVRSTATVATNAVPVAGTFDVGFLPTGAPNCRYRNLGAGSAFTCTTARHTVTQQELDQGYFVPKATFESTSTSNSALTTTVNFTGAPVFLTAAGKEKALAADIVGSRTDDTRDLAANRYAAGEKVPYSFRITNTGLVTEAVAPTSGNFTPLVPPGAGNCRYSVLPVGQSYTCGTPRHTVTEQEAADGFFVPLTEWSLTASGFAAKQLTIDGGEVDLAERNPALSAGGVETSIVDTDGDGQDSVGDEVTQTAVITNSGNVRLMDVTADGWDGEGDTLTADEETTLTRSFALSEAQVADGEIAPVDTPVTGSNGSLTARATITAEAYSLMVQGSPVRASVVPRCLGGKVYVYVSVLNEGAGPVDVRVSSDVGVKSFRGVLPGKSGSAALSARAALIGDGRVGVAVTGADGVENEFSVAYDAISCR